MPLCAAAAAAATVATPDGFALRPCGSGSDGARLCTRTRECASSSPRAGVRRGQRMLSCVLHSSARRSNAALSTTYTYAHASRVYKEANVVPSPLRPHPTPPHRAATPNSCPAAAAARRQPSPCAHGAWANTVCAAPRWRAAALACRAVPAQACIPPREAHSNLGRSRLGSLPLRPAGGLRCRSVGATL